MVEYDDDFIPVYDTGITYEEFDDICDTPNENSNEEIGDDVK